MEIITKYGKDGIDFGGSLQGIILGNLKHALCIVLRVSDFKVISSSPFIHNVTSSKTCINDY